MTDLDIRCITVRQPWAFGIAHLGKSPENRVRTTSYRGPLGIHAGKAWDAAGGQDSRITSRCGALRPDDDRIVYGAVIALAQLVDCHEAIGGCCLPWGDRSFTTLGSGPTVVFHLVLDYVRPLAEPIPARGQLGLPWRPDAALLADLRAAYARTEPRQRPVVAGEPPAGGVS